MSTQPFTQERLRWAWETAAEPDHPQREEAICVLECFVGWQLGWGSGAEPTPEERAYQHHRQNLERWLAGLLVVTGSTAVQAIEDMILARLDLLEARR